MTSLTMTPPMGIWKAWTQVMNRSITAIGRASGKVTKKNAVFSESVRISLASSVFFLVPASEISSGSFFSSWIIFSLRKESFVRRDIDS